MERRECPDCGKVFESKWRSKVQERYDEHRGRANPCTRRKGEPWVQEHQPRELEPVPGLEDLEGTIVRLDDHIRFVHVISRSFDQMNSHAPFACMPNIDRNVVWYVFDSEARQAPLQAFVDVWFLAVFVPKVAPWLRETWPRWARFAGEVSQVTSSYAFVGGEMREGHFRLLKRSEIYRKSSEAIKGHLSKGTRAARNALRLRIAQTNLTP